MQTANSFQSPAAAAGGPLGGGHPRALTDSEFRQFQEFIFQTAGIRMSDAKKALVAGRLAKRLKALGLQRYDDYYQLISKATTGLDLSERQTAVNLLTTNETYFFREPKHFDFIRDKIIPQWRQDKVRLWSAASSTGEEAYTLAMLMMRHGQHCNWEITGTDLNTQVVAKAQRGQYHIERSHGIPKDYLHDYCLKGIGSQAGTFLINRDLRKKVQFNVANLCEDMSVLGLFDLVLLRNVMIYFDLDTKRKVVTNVLNRLRPNGWLLVGHAESLNGVTEQVRQVQATIYRKLD